MISVKWYLLKIILVYFFCDGRYSFLNVPDKHMCPYCESIQWWGLDVQVLQDVFDKKLKLVNNVFNMSIIIKTRLKFIVYIFCNYNFVQCFNNWHNFSLHYKRFPSSCNGEVLICLITWYIIFTKKASTFLTIINIFEK